MGGSGFDESMNWKASVGLGFPWNVIIPHMNQRLKKVNKLERGICLKEQKYNQCGKTISSKTNGQTR